MKRLKESIIGRLGAAKNLRPAGTHRSTLRYGSRKFVRQALRRGNWEDV